MSIRVKKLKAISLVSALLVCSSTLTFTAQAKKPSGPKVFVVNTTEDNIMGPCNKSHCSLREAILAANNNPGKDKIVFEFKKNSNCSDYDGAEICRIDVNDPGLPTITEAVEIDGSIPENRVGVPGSVLNPSVDATERPGVELVGVNLITPSSYMMLVLGADDTVVKGLIFNRVSCQSCIAFIAEQSTNTKFLGNYVGTDATGTRTESCDVLADDGCSSFFGGFLVSFGNNEGTGAILGTSNQFGGKQNNERNVIGGNTGFGVALLGETNSSIVGNFVGVNAYGSAEENFAIFGPGGPLINELFHVEEGIDILGDFIAGGKTLDNRIDGNVCVSSTGRPCIRMIGRTFFEDDGSPRNVSVEGTVVVNNIVGSDLVGNAPGSCNGISLTEVAINSNVGFDIVDGDVVPQPNVVTKNGRGGIVLVETIDNEGVRRAATDNTVLFNQITDNSNPAFFTFGFCGAVAGLENYGGIDLTLVQGSFDTFNGNGLTPNDSKNNLDADTGANNLQNFPRLQNANLDKNKLNVVGKLNTAAMSKYRIDFYANESAVLVDNIVVEQDQGLEDNVLLSEGKVHLGHINVETNAEGFANVNAKLKANNLPAGCQVADGPMLRGCITATATQILDDVELDLGSTSEFSPAVAVTQD